MDLLQAISMISRIRVIPNLPDIRIIDVGGAGSILALKKTLISEDAFLLLKKFTEDQRLSIAEFNGHYLISSGEIVPK